MPDEVNEIKINVDETDAVTGLKAVEQATKKVEDALKSLGAQQISFGDKTQSAQRKAVASLERRAAFHGLTPQEKHLVETEQMLGGLKGDEGLKARTEATKQLL